MSPFEGPTHDRLPVPEGLDVDTLRYVLVDVIAQIAMDYGLTPADMPAINIDDLGSLEEAIHALEVRVQDSDRISAEKTGALAVLDRISTQITEAIRQTELG